MEINGYEFTEEDKRIYKDFFDLCKETCQRIEEQGSYNDLISTTKTLISK